MKYNILQMSPDVNYVDGRSYYVYLLSKYLKKNGHKIFLATNSGDSLERFESLDIPVSKLSGLSARHSFLKSLRHVSKFVRENKIDIIHTHHRYYELLANSLRKSHKIKTVFTALSIVDKRYFVEYKSDAIIAVSNSVKEMLIKKFRINKSKIVVIPNFVDTEELNISETTDKKTISRILKEKYSALLLSAGRFDKEKNFETLLGAMSKLKDINLKLILIGEGSEKSKYEKLIKAHSLNAEIIPPRKCLKEFFEIAEICILSSIRDPLPGFMLQSGLYRKAFIGTDVDGIAETIINRFNGLLFKSRDENDLASKIRMFVTEKELSGKCSSNLNKLVSKKFTQKTVVPQVERLYNRLMN